MIKRIVCIAIVSMSLISCGGSRNLNNLPTTDVEAVKVIENHYDNEVEFKTLTGKLRTVYQDEDRTQSVNMSFRMEKDEAIWMSAQVLGFQVAKAYITPSSVSYYERVSQTYFDGDFRLLSDLLGTPIDFQKLQNLLIGQAIYDLREEPYKLTESPRGYQFQPAEEEEIKKMFLLNPASFKASAQQLSKKEDNRGVTVTYEDYQEISGQLFPGVIKIIANKGSKNTRIELTYRNIRFNEEVGFPFEIPSGYEEISLE